jgi:hypothetical protein
VLPKPHAGRRSRAAFVGIEPHDIERLAGRDADAAALADREVDDAVVGAQDAAVHVHDLTRFGRVRPQLADDLGIVAVGHEADVLAVRLVGNGQGRILAASSRT